MNATSTYYRNCRWDVLELLGDDVGRVLDVGCGEGATGAELLRTGRAARVDGIELVPAAAEEARHQYRTVAVGDLDRVDRSALDGDYDTMMCNDVLEHVADPWSVLRTLTEEHVRPGGTVIVSIPNVQCIEVVAPLLGGRFEYCEDGVLDRTHLRFFTRSSGRKLVRAAGLMIEAEAAGRVGAGRGRATQLVGSALGPFGVRQLLYRARHRV